MNFPMRCACLLMLLSAVAAGCDGGGHARTPPPKIAPVNPFEIPDPDVVLLITGGTDGMLEVCNCPGPMPGGVSRRSGLIRCYREAFKRTFLLDTGDCFWIDPADLRNGYVLKAYRRIGYDAVALGVTEWMAPTDRLRSLLTGEPMAYLSTNVRPGGDAAELPLSPVVQRQWDGVKLAVVSYTPPEAFVLFSPARRGALTVAPRKEFIARVAELKSRGCIVVAVAHTDDEGAEALARDCRADVVLRAHTSRSDEHTRWVGDSLIVKVGGYDVVGALALKVAKGQIERAELRIEPVDKRWPVDQRVMQIYQAYAHAAMRQKLDADRTEGLAYVPSADCGRCHHAQYTAWEKGPHARAYKTLVRVKRTGDPNCLMCHTSGFGTKRGFYAISKTPKLAGVNCQDCHRFNISEHQRKGFVFPPAGENVCTSCHTPITDPGFDYKRRAGKIRCPHKVGGR